LIECLSAGEKPSGYFLDANEKEFSKCQEGCEKCSSKSVCNKCDFSNGYLSIEETDSKSISGIMFFRKKKFISFFKIIFL